MAKRRYRTKADERWALKDDERRRNESKERLLQQDKEWEERQARPAWGVMQLDARWFWAAWTVRSEDAAAGGFEVQRDAAEAKALSRSGARLDDWVMETQLHEAYRKLKAEGRLE